MVPRLRTVASQVMEPMVTPSTVARVPNLRSTSNVLLFVMLDGFERSEARVSVPAPSAKTPVTWFRTLKPPVMLAPAPLMRFRPAVTLCSRTNLPVPKGLAMPPALTKNPIGSIIGGGDNVGVAAKITTQNGKL